ncbi:MAG: hypothetical protein LC104_10175 [Bacteroidales bacterium]|nr:hypothetical protein [Bacteroidales bacterium]
MWKPRPGFDLLVISGLILFLELALIRWLPAHVLFLSFFTNTVLLASFVGMSVGCMIARKPGRELRRTPILLASTLLAGTLVELFRKAVERHTSVGNQASPEVVYFGTEVSALFGKGVTIPVEVIAGFFFLLSAAIMVGPGQELGRAFNRIPNRTRAYALDLLGSLCGIGLLAACSLLQLPPIVWFTLIAVGLVYLLIRPQGGGQPVEESASRSGIGGVPLAALVIAIGLSGITSGLVKTNGLPTTISWSPYYRVDLHEHDRTIVTNLISHQRMHPRSESVRVEYEMPYLFHRATGRSPIRRILIIGAGSGNDLARALYWAPEATIDAVEIDPVIQKLGATRHPDDPYANPRVTLHLNDGRNFLRKAPSGEYDLVIFALIDSLVLHSGYSNLRLESYLFTRESFADVARVLKPDGWAAVYNFFRQGWIAARIRDSLQAEFGTEPVVLTDSPLPGDQLALDSQDFLRTNGFAAFIAGRSEAIQPLRQAFATHDNQYWVPLQPPITRENAGGFGEPPAGSGKWLPLRTLTIAPSTELKAATDDWPFLYVRQPRIPSLTWRGIGLTLFLSALLWYLFRSRRGTTNPESPQSVRGDGGLLLRSFLLGAGFMLIETKAVVQMALLFGSTWTVNTVVFAAILVMALLGNLYAGWVKPKRLEAYYIGLFVAMGAGLLVPMRAFLGLDPMIQVSLACALVFSPILFAGVIFPTTFARTPYPDRFFGANVAGALVGGLAENASILLGFQYLLCVACGFYALSGLFGGRALSTSAMKPGV